MAPCPARPAIADDGAGGGADPRWPARTANWCDEPGRSFALDSLARSVDIDPVGGRQLLLHGLPLRRAADARPPLAAGGPHLAAVVAEQMAGSASAGPVPVELRGVQPVGQPVVDGLARAGLLHGSLCHRRLLPRSRVLQIR